MYSYGGKLIEKFGCHPNERRWFRFHSFASVDNNSNRERNIIKRNVANNRPMTIKTHCALKHLFN